MKQLMASATLGLILATGVGAVTLRAEEDAKPLPTLLIRGEVVSVEPEAEEGHLLKIKDRYGFETPIYVTAETAITRGEETTLLSALSVGEDIEVEYNFDVNTAQRHAVSVALPAPEPGPEEQATAVDESTAAAAPATGAPATEADPATAGGEPLLESIEPETPATAE